MEKREECDIYREHIESKINRNEQRLNNHSERLDKLEQDRATIFTKIENLVDKLREKGNSDLFTFTLIPNTSKKE